MNICDLEDAFSPLDLHVRQAQLLQELGQELDARQRDILDVLLTEALDRALEDVEQFGGLLLNRDQESRDGSSLTMAAPITSTAPMTPNASIRSRSSSADKSTATTGSM